MSTPIIFIDTEFTDLANPQLLSLGAVTLDGREHYVELDLTSDIGQTRVGAASDFVRSSEVLEQWGQIAGAKATAWEMGRRTGDWLLSLTAESGTRVEVAYDYATDFQLLEQAVRDSGLWDRVRDAVLSVDVNALTGTIDGELAAVACYAELKPRQLYRHHALADALALRAAYIAVKGSAMQLARFARSEGFRRLVTTVNGLLPIEQRDSFDAEGWVRRWLLEEHRALGYRRPLDVLDEPGGGVDALERLILAAAHGVYL